MRGVVKWLLVGLALATASARQPAPPHVDPELIARLGSPVYEEREAATRALLRLGPEAVEELQAALADQTHPEVIHRLRFVIEHVQPPVEAALVLSSLVPGLQPGDVITHVGGRRVRGQAEFRTALRESVISTVALARTPIGPVEVGPLRLGELQVADYALPRGPILSEAVRFYAEGYVERALERLDQAERPIPEGELPRLLHARLAYTAGDVERAFELLGGDATVARPLGSTRGRSYWSLPSALDDAGPGKAPFHLELALLTRAGPAAYETPIDPDLRVQRILVPARRFETALRESAGLWWTRFRDRLTVSDRNDAAGNALAVCGWMLSEMDLASECCRLIRPRSEILNYTWVRVRTDAWLDFLAGREREALDGFYEDARQVLHRPLGETREEVTRNPVVAAAVAFFLYQFPADPRVGQMLEIVNDPDNRGIEAYVSWMLHALRAENYDVIRAHAGEILPRLTDAQAPGPARAVALIEYVSDRPQADVFLAARERLRAALPVAQAVQETLWVDVLALLAAGQPREALTLMAGYEERPELRNLASTARFLADPPATAIGQAALRDPLLAVPLGGDGQSWLVLARDWRLMRFDAATGALTAVAAPGASWFPGPRNWPWIGREPATGRAWVYGLRRVVEVGENGLRLNIDTDDIAAFDRHVTEFFSPLAEAVAAVPPPSGEAGEFLREEIVVHGEYVSDPDLPEIGLVEILAADPRVLHVALRGGPHLLIDTQRRLGWSSVELARRVNLPPELVLFPQAAAPVADEPPRLWLMTDHGLLEFDTATDRLARIALPEEDPFQPVIPESTPYERRDPRFVYCALPPERGGTVYRLHVESGRIERLLLVNEALPPGYYRVRSRAALRAAIDEDFRLAGLPGLQVLIADARDVVRRWLEAREP